MCYRRARNSPLPRLPSFWMAGPCENHRARTSTCWASHHHRPAPPWRLFVHWRSARQSLGGQRASPNCNCPRGTRAQRPAFGRAPALCPAQIIAARPLDTGRHGHHGQPGKYNALLLRQRDGTAPAFPRSPDATAFGKDVKRDHGCWSSPANGPKFCCPRREGPTPRPSLDPIVVAEGPEIVMSKPAARMSAASKSCCFPPSELAQKDPWKHDRWDLKPVFHIMCTCVRQGRRRLQGRPRHRIRSSPAAPVTRMAYAADLGAGASPDGSACL